MSKEISDQEIEIITLNMDNIDSEHICCAIENDKKIKNVSLSRKHG
ncbi:MAG: hypothetical protein KO316_10880 [Methanobacterium sp.]|jgi:hypothetical protein|nr:hypothetical protein [Methanobacterium sp.]